MRAQRSDPAAALHGRARRCALLCGALAGWLGAAVPARAQDSTYVAHPRLLFTAAEVDSLRAKLQDGGEDDAAWLAIRSWAIAALPLPVTSLLGSWEGFHTVSQLGLATWIEPDGSAFAAKAREVVLYLVRNRTVTNDEFASSLRLQTMALGYDLAFGGATPAERDELRDEMRGYLDYMPSRFNYYCQAYNPYCGNHGMTVGAAVGLATIALWDDVAASGRDSLAAARAFGDQLVAKCLDDVLASDGAYREGVLYGGWIVRVGAPYFEARRRFDGVDFAADPRLRRMIEWLCYELSPDGGGRTNNLNDSPWSTRPLALHNTVLEWAQMRWSDPLARYLHEHVVGPFGFDYGVYADRVATALWAQKIDVVDPGEFLRRGRLFADRGLYAHRSGWKTGATGNEFAFSFFAGTFWGGHAQEDQGQFTLAAEGVRWATDCGAVGSSQTPKQTESHNLVLVDGRGQHNAGSSIGTDGTMAASLLTGFADYLRADLAAAYATYSPFNAPGVPFPSSDWSWGYDGGNPLERAGRLCLVVAGAETPPYVLVADDIRKDGSPHTFDWLLHTTASNTIDLGADPALLAAPPAACDVYFAHPRPADLVLSWAPWTHGGADPATSRIVARAETVEPRFFVALVPRPAATPAPAYSATGDSLSTTLAIDWGAVRDVAVFDPYGVPVTGEVETDGRMALVRSGPSGPERWLLGEGTMLHAAGLDLVLLDAPASAACAGDTVHLSRADVAFDAWAPAAVVVAAPSGPVPFVRHGDRVRTPTSAAEESRSSRLALDITGAHPSGRAVDLWLRLPRSDRVRVRLLDVRGACVATLLDAWRPAGAHRIAWSGAGRRVAPGVYLAVAETGTSRVARKLVLSP